MANIDAVAWMDVKPVFSATLGVQSNRAGSLVPQVTFAGALTYSRVGTGVITPTVTFAADLSYYDPVSLTVIDCGFY